ncbi:unnamed protein product [Spirodela intermedia]|uniref:t-SNARE coiled-coil homology domain-containing protein n=1 Tax=Spirodela intermedia TaxID=51605 RepID=A0A7I8L592_SPIIN|nr:unnamed protein product [Spirodela intermedia]
MSFQDLEGTSTQPPGLRKTGTLIEMASSIFRLNTSVARFRRLVDAVGTAKDSLEHRRTLFDARQSIGRMVKEISGKLKALTVADSTVPLSKRVEGSKLAGDFQAVLVDFQRAQKLLAEREFAYVPPPPSPRQISPVLGEDTTPPLVKNQEHERPLGGQQIQEMFLLENEFAFNEAMVEEREEGIREIQHQVAQVNEIFHDLAVLIGQQGIVIAAMFCFLLTDDIVKNIEAASAETADAEAQFAKGSNSMKSRSSWVKQATFLKH